MKIKKIVIIDGQGGKLGSLLTARIKKESLNFVIYAIGTNSIATAAMLKVGADFGATGENPAVVNCRDADIIAGPIGIIAADSLLGEVTPAIAAAVGQSAAEKILLPMSRCNIYVAGTKDAPVGEMIEVAVKRIGELF